jgi:heat shock protein HslJ
MNPKVVTVLRTGGSESPVSKNRGLAIESVRWRLTALDADSLSPDDYQAAPYIELDAENHRASGVGACNRFTAAYTLEGARLTFSPAAMTRMACARGMETEARFMRALSETREAAIVGDELHFRSAGGLVLARFVAVPPR